MSDLAEANRQFERGDELSTKGVQAMQAGQPSECETCFRQAIDAYQTALEAAPGNDVLLVSNLKLCIGARLQGLGDIDGALEHHDDALAQLIVHPDIYEGGDATDLYAQARLNRADCWLAQGKTDDAKLEVEDVLAMLPDHPYGQYMLGRITEAEDSPASTSET